MKGMGIDILTFPPLGQHPWSYLIYGPDQDRLDWTCYLKFGPTDQTIINC